MEVLKKEKSAIVTSKELLTIYAPKALGKHYCHVHTVSQALDAGSHGLGQLNRELGTQRVEALIKIQMVYLNELLALKRPLNEIQIDEIASEVVTTYYHLTMADVHVIMRRARTGQYGEFFESLTMPKVLGWFAKYFEERCEVAAQRQLDRHAQDKEWIDPSRKSGNDRELEAFSVAKSRYLVEKAMKKKGYEQKEEK